MTTRPALAPPAVQTRQRLVAACVLSALADADTAVRSHVAAGANVDGDALAREIAAARETLQLAETALAALSRGDAGPSGPLTPGSRNAGSPHTCQA